MGAIVDAKSLHQIVCTSKALVTRYRTLGHSELHSEFPKP
jgi:hypothetical protein